MIYYVDIDETICFYDGERYYPDARPLRENIKKINELYDDGHTIVYWTARGGVTGRDWTELTANQLEEWGAKHHDLKLGKPHYDVFIDDKAINSRDFFGDTIEG